MIAILRRNTFVCWLLALVWIIPIDGRADTVMPLATPAGPVVLSIGGHIHNANQAGVAHFDMDMLKRLKPTVLSTHTPWTDGLTQFKGVLVADVLRLVAVSGTQGEFRALNDYAVNIPLSDFDTFDAILAYEMNGKPISRREKGPLWLIYPIDQNDALQTPRYRNRMVWQLRTITVQ